MGPPRPLPRPRPIPRPLPRAMPPRPSPSNLGGGASLNSPSVRFRLLLRSSLSENLTRPSLERGPLFWLAGGFVLSVILLGASVLKDFSFFLTVVLVSFVDLTAVVL